MREHITTKELAWAITEAGTRLQTARVRKAPQEIRFLEIAQRGLRDLQMHHEEEAEAERRDLQSRADNLASAAETQRAFADPDDPFAVDVIGGRRHD